MARKVYMNKLVDRVLKDNEKKYERGSIKSSQKRSKDKKLRAGLKWVDEQYRDAVASAAATDFLLTEQQGYLEAENEMEKTFKFSQDEIKANVGVGMANKAFDLKLKEFGPYYINFSRNGTHSLICGRKGHVASMDWRKGELRAELHLNETVQAATYLQNEQYFSVAQKKYTFIYDHEGTELHRLKQHIEVKHLEFLPYHYLLVTAGQTGFLKYHDTSTGQLVSELRTKLGPTVSMTQNPWNAVMHLGHANGTVSLWAPNMSSPLVRLLSARGLVTSVAVDRQGMYMATTGSDCSLKIWDIRMFKEMHVVQNLPTPGSNVRISDTGLLAVTRGPHLTLWKDVFRRSQEARPCFTSSCLPNRNTPYMSHMFAGNKVNNIKFVPFEDLIGVGHQDGVTNLIIPGAGEANYDALEVNPFETAKQRKEQEVISLLNKLPADSISLDPTVVGTVVDSSSQIRLNAKDLAEITITKKNGSKNDKYIPKTRPDIKGKNSGLRTYLRKKTQNIIDERKLRVQKQLQKEKEFRSQNQRVNRGEIDVHHKDFVDEALRRFK